MVLSLRRDPGAAPIGAYLFTDDFAEIDALSADLDAEFGREGWRRVDHAAAPRVLREQGNDGAIAVFAVNIWRSIRGTGRRVPH